MSKIEWTDKTWNPVHGCTKISPGCANCYAERMSNRLAGMGTYGYSKDNPFAVFCNEFVLNHPLNWKKPAKIFVNSMGDLFHEEIPFEFIAKVFAVMQLAQHHTFMVLTKRPERMKMFYDWLDSAEGKSIWLKTIVSIPHSDNESWSTSWPFRNIWLGVSVENNDYRWRIEKLLKIPAAVRFVSVEPMLRPVKFRPYTLTGRPCFVCEAEDELGEERGTMSHPINCGWRIDNGHEGCSGIDWVICGGESGPGARPVHPDWIRSLRDQCKAAGVKYFFKQWGEWLPSYEAGTRSEETDQYKRTFGDCWVKAYYRFPDGQGMVRVGKKKAGRLLDGRTWNEFPVMGEGE